ncbi:CHAT domain-containing protein [Streptomyces chartreusis]|uniref:CHAT domain-containing protein n=1 Tax=Streptomyces chartreusis TaxID=1969 RepID=UPI00381E751F
MTRDEALAALYTRLERADPGGDLDAIGADALEDVLALLVHEPEVNGDEEATVALGWIYTYRLRALPPGAYQTVQGQALAQAAAFLISPQYLQNRSWIQAELADFLDSFPDDVLDSYGWQPAYAYWHARLLAEEHHPLALRLAAGMLHRTFALTGSWDSPVASLLGEMVDRHHRVTGEVPQPLGSYRGDPADALVDYAVALLDYAADHDGDPHSADLGIVSARRAAASAATDGTRAEALSVLAQLLRIRDQLDAAVEAWREAASVADAPESRYVRLHNLAVALEEMHGGDQDGERNPPAEAVDVKLAKLGLGIAATREADLADLVVTAKFYYNRHRPDERFERVLGALREAGDEHGEAALLLHLYNWNGDLETGRSAIGFFRRALADAGRHERPEARLRLAAALSHVVDENFPGALEEARELLERNLKIRKLDPGFRMQNASLLETLKTHEYGIPARAIMNQVTMNEDGTVDILFNREYLVGNDHTAANSVEEVVVGRASHDWRGAATERAFMAPKFTQDGRLGPLDETISRLRARYMGASRDTSAGIELALCLAQRFEYARDLASLEDAVELVREIVPVLRQDDSNRPMALTQAASVIRLLATVTRDGGIAAEGIGLAEKAIEEAAPGDPRRPLYHLNRLLSLREPYRQDQTPVGLRWHRQELRKICEMPDHPAVPMALRKSLLADALLMSLDLASGRRGEVAVGASPVTGALWESDEHRERDEREVEEWRVEAFVLLRTVLASVSEGGQEEHTARARLGHALLSHGSPDEQREGLELLAAAVAQAGGLTPIERCEMAWECGRAAAEFGERERAAELYKLAVEIMPAVVSRRVASADEHRELGSLHLLPAEAAEACVVAGDAVGAVMMLEQGRGLLLSRALDQRADLDALAADHPDLATRFRGLSEAFAGAADPSRLVPSAGDLRHTLATDWDDLLTEIRSRPGYQGFLLPPAPEELLPSFGSTVYLTAGWNHAHALLLTSAGIRALELDGLTLESTTELANVRLRVEQVLGDPTAPITEVFRAEHSLSDLLATLWTVIAEPVLTAIGHLDAHPVGDWPHIHWIATGPFAFLPLHAAGTSDVNVLDRVVSSYLPTARFSRRTTSALTGPALAVAVPGTPPLKAAMAEAQLVIDAVGGTLLAGAEAGREAVLASLATHPIAHFACHARSDPASLTSSHLVLTDTLLTVHDLADLNLPAASLAFLSACSTAQPSLAALDQSLPISTAFQIAGYSDVIATLWPVADPVAHALAAAVYGRISAGTPPALALHDSVRELRAQYPHTPWLWSAHTHLGHLK